MGKKVVFTTSKNNPQELGPERLTESDTKRDMGDRKRSSRTIKAGGVPLQNRSNTSGKVGK